MNLIKTSAVLLSVSLLFTGCVHKKGKAKPVGVKTQEVAQPEEVIEPIEVPKRDQELTISTEVNEKALEKGIEIDYVVKLNNLEKTDADILLKNTGDKLLTLDTIVLDDATKMFKLDKSKCPKTLQADESCSLHIAFLGTDSGQYSSVIAIKSNDKRRIISHISVEADSENKYKASLIAHNKFKEVKRDVEVKFDALNNKQYITVKNSGLDTLQMSSLKFSGPDKANFSYETTCKRKLAVKESCEITINYDKTKKDGYSLAQLVIASNGVVSPSDKIRLIGYSKPYFVSIKEFTISKNVREFMDDYFESKRTYYFRTIFQTNVDYTLESSIDKEIAKFFEKNGYKITRDASKADKIITIYPNITLPSNEAMKQSNTMLFNITIEGYVATKANTNGKIKSHDNNITFDHDVTHTQFESISTIDTFVNKEQFQFGIQINVDNVSDKYEVYDTVSNIVTSKLFNVLGMRDSKGTN